MSRMSRTLLALRNFLALSESMAKAAGDQAWESLERLGEERAMLLNDLPADLDAHLLPAEQADARTIIERCQVLDEQTRSLAQARQNEISTLLRGLTPVT